MSPDYHDIFGPEGEIAGSIAGFQSRPGQSTMARAVADTFQNLGRLVVEAGTGTGKTLAYLVPSLLAGHKVIISTGTKALQEQLYGKDLPLARQTLKTPVRVALLKGRANYLCLHRLDIAEGDRRMQQPKFQRRLQQIREWKGRSDSGDLAEVGDVADGSPVWGWVSSTTDNCLGNECPRFQDCFVFKARRNAQEADVVVVNHHLLFADMALREEGFGELLPGADAIVLDEAHQIPEIAGTFFGMRLSSRQFHDLIRDAHAEHRDIGGDSPALLAVLSDLESAANSFDHGLGQLPERVAWQTVIDRPGIPALLDTVQAALQELENTLEPMGTRSKGLGNCLERARKLSAQLGSLREPSRDQVRWLERYSPGFAMNSTPLDIAPIFRQMIETSPMSWVFTSATLAVNRSFEHYSQRLGLEAPATLILDSPFDYRRNALLYLPSGLPDPNDSLYTRGVVDAALPLIRASGGGAFLLCTSYRALQEAAALLRTSLEVPLLVQGEMGRGELLQRFREAGNAVLVGTSSFWEGVDVRGAALRLVIIDRLPFTSPGDPVLQARLEAMREQGQDPFMSYQLPQAVIALKQGAGRLIRDANDRGVLMLCDPRLRTRQYGRIFLRSLPEMPQTRDLAQACRFFEDEAA